MNAARIILLFTLLNFGAWAGCTRTTNPDDKDKEKEERVVSTGFRVLPASSLDTKTGFAHPHSWVQTQQKIKASGKDEQLELTYQQALVTANFDNQFIDRSSTESEIGEANVGSTFSRPVSLAAGQQKSVEQTLFVPQASRTNMMSGLDMSLNRAYIHSDIRDRQFGTLLQRKLVSIDLLADYQTQFVVLGDVVERQTFWSRMSVTKWPSSDLVLGSVQPYQCVYITSDDAKINLPSQLHGWLSTSTVCWNDTSAEQLTLEQRTAMLDWLFSGGRLIVNGPVCIDGLANSFLSDLLPLQDLRNDATQAEILADRFNKFSLGRVAGRDVDDANKALGSATQQVVAASISGQLCRAKLTASAAWVPGCDLMLAECRVGSGRICMSTFDLAAEGLTRWDSYGAFLHAAAFRLPTRHWQDGQNPGFVFESPHIGRERALAVYSNLNLASRDLGINPTQSAANRTAIRRVDPQWNDSSAFSSFAVSLLQSSSGITVPKVPRVTQLLAIYLVILVPANWLVFRLLNRLEWAWVAIPAIAVVGAIWIAHSLQVEIGFARARNSLALLQLQEGRRRGILSQYTTIYTSLSSSFDVSLHEQNGVMLPLAKSTDRSTSPTDIQYVNFDQEGSGIRDLPIRSHTTDTIHAEETVELANSIRITRRGQGVLADDVEDSLSNSDQGLSPVEAIENRGGFDLRSAMLIFRTRNDYGGGLRYVTIGVLRDGQSVKLSTSQVLDQTALSNFAAAFVEGLMASSEDSDLQTVSPLAKLGELIEGQQSASGAASLLIGIAQQSFSELEISPHVAAGAEQTLVLMPILASEFGPLTLDESLCPADLTLPEPDFTDDAEF